MSTIAYFPNVMALAAWADYLIVCLRSDASNKHIINAAVLKALGPRGHLVNISRGWAVDEAALADALRNNVIEGAALDVFDEEPYEGQELLTLDNLVMTPHFGGGTEHAQRRMTVAGAPEPRQPFRRQAGGLAAARAARHGGGSRGKAAVAHRSAGVPPAKRIHMRV